MICPNCGSNNSQIINQVTTKGTDFSASKGCCGAVLLGPIGILCGACGQGRKTYNNQFWVCADCGRRWRA